MEMKVSGSSGEAGARASGGSKKRPPSRLQKHAPASLQLEQAAAAAGAVPAAGAWGDGRAPIPLLSPLVMSPMTPVWEADRREGGSGEHAAQGRSGGGEQQPQQQRGAARHGGGGERQAHDASLRPPAPAAPAADGGWRHPALATPVGEPASLVSFFQSQCAVEVRNAQQ
ncbi:hypothetical protein HU200_025070 [Digitaria exilis]|uniref:Uncharacterized protein n=1 Tax=Digitaria exilis TaxID=1010633 RepID=A0A835C3E7_9POAL|nr:hypothetical protein HU200_025070 [Digitaria exilis]